MRRLSIPLVLIALGLSGQAACGDDDEVRGAGASGGTGGTADSSAGTGGTSGTGGAGASGGAAGSAGAAGAEAGPAPLNPRRIAVARAEQPDGGATVRRLLVAGTDFTTKTEIATLALGNNAVTGRASFDDGDAVPAASGGLAFALERSHDRVHVLSAAGEVETTISVAGPPSGGVVDPQNKAYVLLYNANRIAVVDLAAGNLARGVNLGNFHEPADADGAVDMDDAVVDSRTGRLYIVLGRFDRTTIAAPDFQLACPSWPALLIAVDMATDSIVDLNGSAAGQGVELSLVSPAGMTLDLVNDRLLILNSGCFAPGEAGSQRIKHGVEAVDLTAGTASLLYQPTSQDFLSSLILIGVGEALLNSFDADFTEHWHRWTIGSATLGAELAGVPASPSYDGAGGLLGVAFSSNDAGTSASIVRYALASAMTTTLSSSPWTGTFSMSGGSAIVE